MRRSNLLSNSIPTLLLLSLTACGGDGSSSSDAEPAHFTTASELERQRAMTAAAGGDAGLAYILGAFAFAAPSATSCPTVTRSGDVATAVFDCDDGEGQRVDGRVIATNLGDLFGDGGPAADPTKPVSIRFEGFYQHGATAIEDVALDGTVTLQPTGAMVAELEAMLQGVSVYTEASLVNDGTLTHAGEGGAIEVRGLGRATIHGAWSMDSEEPAGALELRGADVMRANFDDAFGGCVPISIDGHDAGQLCESSDAQPE
jgi:hypothetical protein